LNIYSVLLATVKSNTLSIPVAIKDSEKEIVDIPALIDSGAGGTFIDQNYAKKAGFQIQKLKEPLTARNVDNTPNKLGKITSFVEANVTVNGRTRRLQLLLAGLGKQKVILGFPWLNKENPDINWKTGEFSWRPTKRILRFRIKKKDQGKPAPLLEAKFLTWRTLNEQTQPTLVEEIDPQKHLNQTQLPIP
jgi:hypothetical protein